MIGWLDRALCCFVYALSFCSFVYMFICIQTFGVLFCRPSGRFYGPVRMRQSEARKDLTNDICHFARCHILISSSFWKIKTRNFNPNPCFFSLAKLGTSSMGKLLKLIKSNTKASCEICSKLTKKTSEWCLSVSFVFIVNFEHISHLVLMFLFLDLFK